MKQNQNLYRPFPGEETSLKPHDHLLDAKCVCKICDSKRQKLNPEIFIDEKYHELKTQKSKMLSNKSMSLVSQKECVPIEEFQWYLKKLAFECKTLPNFPILDTIMLEKGQVSFYIFSEQNKSKIQMNSLVNQTESSCRVAQSVPYSLNVLKQRLIQRKGLVDLEYLKSKYKEEHPNFEWAQLDHDSEKLIKEFEKKIKFIDQVLNRSVIIKQKESVSAYSMTQSQEYRLRDTMVSTFQQQELQKVLSKYEFLNLFDKSRIKVCEIEDISYLQLFPILYGEEQHSYVKQVKYFRRAESVKQLFKEAQSYVLGWFQKNDSLEKMEQQFLNAHFYMPQNRKHLKQFPNTLIKRLKPQAEEEYLMYQSYKLLLHLQAQTNIEVQQCLLEFMTSNNGASFWLKSIKHLKYFEKPQVQVNDNQLPLYKHIEQEDYIPDLKAQIKGMFEKVEFQFSRLHKDWQNFENKTINDRLESDRVFKAVRAFKDDPQLFETPKSKKLITLKQSKTFDKSTNDFSDSLNFHTILKSNDQKYKEEMLGINQRFNLTESKSNVTKSRTNKKTSK